MICYKWSFSFYFFLKKQYGNMREQRRARNEKETEEVGNPLEGLQDWEKLKKV